MRTLRLRRGITGTTVVVAVLLALGLWAGSGPGGGLASPGSAMTRQASPAARAGGGPGTPRNGGESTTPDPCADRGQLTDHGGPVQTEPEVYVDFWGWTSDPAGERSYLVGFLSSIGGSSWLSTLTQYCASDDPQLAGQWSDSSSRPPLRPTAADIQGQGLAAARHFGVDRLPGDAEQNVQIVVALPTRIALPSSNSEDCAYHQQLKGTGPATGPHAVLTALPYLPDDTFGTQCGAFSVNGGERGALDGVSIAEGHELAESITDPEGNGWYDDAQPANEVADKCEAQTDYDVHAHGRLFAVQQLWSNATGGCVAVGATPGAPTDVQAVGVDSHVDVSWSPPADDGGTPIIGWSASTTPGTATCTESTATSCVLSRVRNGTTYSITVRASNAVGWSEPSAETTATPSSVPNCTFYGPYAPLQGCDLSGADMGKSDLLGADLAGADLARADLMGADLVGADLAGADLMGADLAGADLFTADLSTSSLAGADLQNGDLTGTDLSGADVSGSNLADVSSSGVTGAPSALPAKWTLVNGYLIGPAADLIEAELSFADLANTDLSQANLAYADLISANVSHADLAGADLDGANVSDADLKGADVSHTDLAVLDPFELLCPNGTYSDDDGGTCAGSG